MKQTKKAKKMTRSKKKKPLVLDPLQDIEVELLAEQKAKEMVASKKVASFRMPPEIETFLKRFDRSISAQLVLDLQLLKMLFSRGRQEMRDLGFTAEEGSFVCEALFPYLLDASWWGDTINRLKQELEDIERIEHWKYTRTLFAKLDKLSPLGAIALLESVEKCKADTTMEEWDPIAMVKKHWPLPIGGQGEDED